MIRRLTAALGMGVVFVSAASATAQVVEAGGKAGVIVATLSSYGEPGSEAAVDPGWRTAVTAGGFVRVRITERFGFQPEVMLSMNGAKLSTTGGNATVEFIDLEIPLLLKWQRASAPGISPYVVGGVTPLVNLSAKVAVEGGREVDVDDSVKGNDIGVTVGAGLQGRHWLVEARFTHGMRDIAEDALGVEGAARRRGLALLGGLKF